MASLNADYVIEQGSTIVIEFQVYDEDLNPVSLLNYSSGTYSLSSYRFRSKVRKSKYTESTIYQCGTTQNFIIQPGQTHEFVQNGFYFVAGNTGFVRMVITYDTTANFKYGNHFYDVELVKSLTGGDAVTKILSGKFDIDSESTR
jgi:hypothetical protein